MGRVLAVYCKQAGIDPETQDGERIASVILALHEIGVRDENELLKALIIPKHRLPRGAHWG
jgi:hypothetical protein